jgi:zinc transport system substrate-binding protein
MKKVSVIILIAAIIFSCGSEKKPTSENTFPTITVSILPEKTFVEKIGGTDFKVNVLVPPGASPESHSLIPSQLKDISTSPVWFLMGHLGFEYSWKDKICDLNKSMKVFDLSEGLNLIAETEETGGHVHEGGVDPHIWMSPVEVKKIAGKIKEVLTQINPPGNARYEKNYQDFVKEIDETDTAIRKIFQGCEGKTIIVFHPSLTYFARDYGLNQVSLESGGKEPLTQHVKEVVDLAKKEKIKVIYIQSEFDRENARVFAEEIGGEIIQVAPLNPDWSKNLTGMAQIMKDNF